MKNATTKPDCEAELAARESPAAVATGEAHNTTKIPPLDADEEEFVFVLALLLMD